MPNKQLKANIDYDGKTLRVNGEMFDNGVTVVDYSKPVSIEVGTDDTVKEYKLYFYSFTGLPVVWIETEGRKDITSKYDYIPAHFKIEENVVTRVAGDVIEADVDIKGRGNSSWKRDDIPKKSYRLKFTEKMSLLDEPKDKSWVLIANYSDKTMLRNQVAYYMGEMSNMDYSPKMHFVELMLNGRYHGTYQLGDNLKISKNRVNVGNDGFLLEIDINVARDNDGVYFYADHLNCPVAIKEPDVEEGDDNYLFIKNFIHEVDSVLYSENFDDPLNGYHRLLDVESFVDWYLINEISKNTDACLGSSCFMNLERGKKLKMGPIWDFDVAFGNRNFVDCTPEGFWVLQPSSTWIHRLFEDKTFVTRVKERFNYFYDRKMDVINYINDIGFVSA